MRARSVALAVATTVALLATQVVAAYAAAPAGERYIVLLRPDADAHGIVTALEHAHGFTSDFRYEAIKGFAARLTPSQLALVRSHPAVAVVSADQTVEAVGSVPLAAGETAPTGVRRIDAASTTSASAASTVAVAVIDTGVGLAHPDLNAVSGKNCVTAGASANDDNGHGSHVAGTIAARNTGSGVVGVAPNTTVYAVKVLNSAGSGTWAQVICGIDWVTANGPSLGIKVANMSLGGSGSSDTNCGYSNGDALHQAICRSTAAGITYAVAAGNSGVSLAGQVPAAYPEVLAVTAMADSDGVRAGAGPRPACRTSEPGCSYATVSNYAVSSGAHRHTFAGAAAATATAATAQRRSDRQQRLRDGHAERLDDGRRRRGGHLSAHGRVRGARRERQPVQRGQQHRSDIHRPVGQDAALLLVPGRVHR